MHLVLHQAAHIQAFPTPSEQRFNDFQVACQEPSLDLTILTVTALSRSSGPGDQLVGHTAHSRNDSHGLRCSTTSSPIVMGQQDICHAGKPLGIPHRRTPEFVHDHVPLHLCVRPTSLALCQLLKSI